MKKQQMFFWSSLAFSMIQWMLAIWSLVPLPFLNAACVSGSSRFICCWSLAWRILRITLLLPLLSHFSCVRLCATPSLGFSRLEHWSGLPFPSPMHKSEKWKVAQSRLTLRDPWTAAYQAMAPHSSTLAWKIPWTEDNLTSMQNECNCMVVWTSFGISLRLVKFCITKFSSMLF